MTQHSPVHHTLLSYHLTLYLIILYCTWQPSSALHDTCRCACYLLVYLTLHVYLWLCVLPTCTCTCCMTQRLTLAQHFVLDLFLICTFHWLLHHLYLTCTPCLIDRLCTCRKWKHSYIAALASITRREHITLQTKTKKLVLVLCWYKSFMQLWKSCAHVSRFVQASMWKLFKRAPHCCLVMAVFALGSRSVVE